MLPEVGQRVTRGDVTGKVTSVKRICLGLKVPAVDIEITADDGTVYAMGRDKFCGHWKLVDDLHELAQQQRKDPIKVTTRRVNGKEVPVLPHREPSNAPTQK